MGISSCESILDKVQGCFIRVGGIVVVYCLGGFVVRLFEEYLRARISWYEGERMIIRLGSYIPYLSRQVKQVTY